MNNLKKFISGEYIPDGTKETLIFESNTEPPKNYIWAKPDGKLYVHDADWEEMEMSSNESSSDFINVLTEGSMVPTLWAYTDYVYNEETGLNDSITKIYNINEISSIAASIFEDNKNETNFTIDFTGIYETPPEVTADTIIGGITFIIEKEGQNNSLTTQVNKINTTHSNFDFWGTDFNINGTTKEYWIPEIRL